jgi:hypothetical protein
MSGLFGNDEGRAAEKLMRAGASNRTILAALPKRRGEEIDPPPRKPADEIRERFPPTHRQMPTYFKPPGSPTIEALPAETVAERFPKEGEIKGVVFDAAKVIDAILRIKDRARAEQDAEKLRRDWERRLLLDPGPLGGEPKRFGPR